MEELIQKYGYIIIFLITLFEGESVLLIAGFMAYQGLLDLELSMFALKIKILSGVTGYIP